MTGSLLSRTALIGLILLSTACSSEPEPQQPTDGAVARFDLPEQDKGEMARQRALSEAMPGKIDPPDAKWTQVDGGARYGEPGKTPLIEMTCEDGMVSVTRNAASDDGAKALLAFVGYRGILRLKVENDGKAWRGALRSDDPHWIAVTGGPFYATVAGGGKVISPASSIAAGTITNCTIEPDATIKGVDETEAPPA
ncbi:hypothetical protein [Croceicoccus naphthovorans]|nr:hypothetical protein [Croceicoccus naphthovorans]MBB3990258.1 hypothetical protein [Croceicoccus naphthovorans]